MSESIPKQGRWNERGGGIPHLGKGMKISISVSLLLIYRFAASSSLVLAGGRGAHAYLIPTGWAAPEPSHWPGTLPRDLCASSFLEKGQALYRKVAIRSMSCLCEWVCMCVCVWKVRDCSGSIVVLFNTVWDGLSFSVTGLRLVLSGRPLHSVTDFWQLRWVYCVLSPLNVQTPAPCLGLRRLPRLILCDVLLPIITQSSSTHLTNKYYYDNSLNVFNLIYFSFFFALGIFFPCRVNTLVSL